jgi:hypothetical protein
MSDKRGGVEALHALGASTESCLCPLQNSAAATGSGAFSIYNRTMPDIKRVLAMLTMLYALFQHSPKRRGVLRSAQIAVNSLSHVLVHVW